MFDPLLRPADAAAKGSSEEDHGENGHLTTDHNSSASSCVSSASSAVAESNAGDGAGEASGDESEKGPEREQREHEQHEQHEQHEHQTLKEHSSTSSAVQTVPEQPEQRKPFEDPLLNLSERQQQQQQQQQMKQEKYRERTKQFQHEERHEQAQAVVVPRLLLGPGVSLAHVPALKAVLNSGETLERAWAVIFINEYGAEQDRVLLLSNVAVYRVSFQWKNCKVKHFNRVPLESVTRIQHGPLVGGMDEGTLLSAGAAATCYAVRIFNREWNDEARAYYNQVDHRTYYLPAVNVSHFGGKVGEGGNFVSAFQTPATLELVNYVARTRAVLPFLHGNRETSIVCMGPLAVSRGVLGRLGSIGKKSAKGLELQKGAQVSPTEREYWAFVRDFQERYKQQQQQRLLQQQQQKQELIQQQTRNDLTLKERRGSFMGVVETKLNSDSSTAATPLLNDEDVAVQPDNSAAGATKNASSDAESVEAIFSRSDAVLREGDDNGSLADASEGQTSGLRRRHKRQPSESRIADLLAPAAEEPLMEPIATEVVRPLVLESIGRGIDALFNRLREIIASKGSSDDSARPFALMTKYLNPLLHRSDRVAQFCVLVLFSWMLGNLGFSMLWAVPMVWLVISIDARRERDLKEESTRTVDATFSLSVDPVQKRNRESCLWLNALLMQMWPNLRQTMEATLARKVRELLDVSELPSVVERIVVESVSVGTRPPRVSNVSGTNPDSLRKSTVKKRVRETTPFDFRWIVDLLYNGDAEIKLAMVVGLDRFRISVPLRLCDLFVEGQVRMDVTFFPMYPYLHQVSMAFINTPRSLDFSVEPMHGFDLMDVPGLREWLQQSVRELINSTVVLPRRLSVPYFYMFEMTASDVVANETAQMRKQREIMRDHVREVEKLVTAGTFAGLLHVRLVEAKQLRTDGRVRSTASPYCIMSCGDGEIMTSAAVESGVKLMKKNGVLEWDEFFEIAVKQGQTNLGLTVLGRNSDGDDFFGTGSVPFVRPEFMRDSPKDIWVKLEDTTTGQIHLQVRYVAEPATA